MKHGILSGVLVALLLCGAMLWRGDRTVRTAAHCEPGASFQVCAWREAFFARHLAPMPDDAREGLSRQPRVAWQWTWGFYDKATSDVSSALWVYPDGTQHRVAGYARRVLVLGGSVASGWFASDESTTWWALLADDLDAEVLNGAYPSARAWDEVRQYDRLAAGFRPDLVLDMNGLNDLLFERDAEQFGTKQNVRVLDQEQQDAVSARYLAAMRALHERAGDRLVVVLQPSVWGKARSATEDVILLPHLHPWHTTEAELSATYDAMEAGLRADGIRVLRPRFGSLHTFTDLWHFADPGHAELAGQLARDL